MRGLPAGTGRLGAVRGTHGQAGRRAALRQLPPDPDPDRRVRAVTGRADAAHPPFAETVIVEADGGSRGNPGPAGYGAVVRDAGTGEVLAERKGFLGVT